MLSIKKEADKLDSNEVLLAKCPICEAFVMQMYYMQDATTKKRSKWYHCSCGVIWQAHKPDGTYDLKYWTDRHKYDPKIERAVQYPVYLYAPIIEELIYGRKVLIVGRENTYLEEAFARRGWIPYSIDKNTSFKTSDRLIACDFETYVFDPEVKFNLIWFKGTLECFNNPKEALAKAKSLLPEDGIIYIDTPDTDFINTRHSSNFVHWKADYNSIMWNKRSLTTYLENLGFVTIMCRSNYEHRFDAWDNIHGIWQKKFF